MFQKVFTPKDKLAEWFELYAKAMELNVWTSTNLVDSKWDDVARKWTISLEREKDGRKETRTNALSLSLSLFKTRRTLAYSFSRQFPSKPRGSSYRSFWRTLLAISYQRFQ